MDDSSEAHIYSVSGQMSDCHKRGAVLSFMRFNEYMPIMKHGDSPADGPRG